MKLPTFSFPAHASFIPPAPFHRSSLRPLLFFHVLISLSYASIYSKNRIKRKATSWRESFCHSPEVFFLLFVRFTLLFLPSLVPAPRYFLINYIFNFLLLFYTFEKCIQLRSSWITRISNSSSCGEYKLIYWVYEWIYECLHSWGCTLLLVFTEASWKPFSPPSYRPVTTKFGHIRLECTHKSVTSLFFEFLIIKAFFKSLKKRFIWFEEIGLG